ncbi:hypothetical protein GCM10022284_23940 [Streptomyces hundungensis]
MRKLMKAAIAASLVVGSIAITAPAEAATASPMSTHRGSSGCFNWSWADGVSTTTVYFHNTCNYTSTINIWWRQGGSDYMRASTVAADGKGSLWHDGSVKSIQG